MYARPSRTQEEKIAMYNAIKFEFLTLPTSSLLENKVKEIISIKCDK